MPRNPNPPRTPDHAVTRTIQQDGQNPPREAPQVQPPVQEPGTRTTARGNIREDR